MVALIESMTGDHPGRPCLVISNRPEAGGLGKAEALGVPTAVVDHKAYPDRPSFEAALDDALEGAQILCLAGFMRILTPAFVARRAGRILNIHPSLLPKYQGLDTHQRALAAGDAEHGCTVHEVTGALDAGPVLGQAKVHVLADDTPETLAARVLAEEHRLYPAVLRQVLSDEARGVTLT